jgi:hypothetical protein
MEKEFISHEQALALKELGFDEPCLGYWRNEDSPNPITIGQYTTKEDMEYEISGQDEYHNFKNIIALAPTFSQAFRWFREKHNIYSIILHSYADNKEVKDRFFYEVTIGKKLKQELEYHTTYEEAELACLKKLIEIVKYK